MNRIEIVAELRTHYQDRYTFIKATTALTNQARARCRSIVAASNPKLAEAATTETGRAKLIKAADELLKQATSRTFDDLALAAAMVVEPILAAKKPLENADKARAKDIEKLAKKLPAIDWVQSVRGFGVVSFGQIIAEAGDLSAYANPDKLKKRMGLAVIDGRAQRRCTDVDLAAAHGFNPRRRSLMYVVGDTILRAQLRKDADGNRIALGELGEKYIRDRAHAEAEGKKAPHYWAKRRVEQELLIGLWCAWNKVARKRAAVDQFNGLAGRAEPALTPVNQMPSPSPACCARATNQMSP